ncbi:MAG: hypothetical protein ACTJLL_00675 [Anaplasma sp.]
MHDEIATALNLASTNASTNIRKKSSCLSKAMVANLDYGGELPSKMEILSHLQSQSQLWVPKVKFLGFA